MYVRQSLGAVGSAFPASVEQWRSLLASEGSDLPLEFLLGWLKHESGGNPCSTGIPGVEAGMFQTYHPTDDKYGATFAQLREGCSGQSVTGTVRRDLQVKSGLNYVRGKRDAARAHLARVGASWSENSADFWSMVKQEHALPCVAVDLLPLVTRKLGRPPNGWREFRDAVMATPASGMPAGCAGFAASASKRGLRNRLEDTLANAETVGAYGAGGASGSLSTDTVKVAVVLGTLAVLAAMMFRHARHTYAR